MISRDLIILLGNAHNVAALTATYERVLEQILRELAAGVSRPGAARARDLVARLMELVDRLDPRKASPIRTWIRRELPKAFVLGDRAATRQLREDLAAAAAGRLAVNATWTAVNATALRGLVAAMESTLGQAAAGMRASLGLMVRRTQVTLLQSEKIRQATTSGIVRGSTGQQVADDIASILLGKKVKPEVRKRLSEIGFRGSMFHEFEAIARGQLIQVGKVRMNVRDYADLVARTQMREAATVATVVRLQQNGIDHVQISRHAQQKIDECTPFAGRVFYVGPLEKDPLGFPKLSQTPGVPFHPRCRHVVMPFVVGFKTDKAMDKAKEEAAKLPRRFLGKTSAEVRSLVKDLDAGELAALNLQEAA